MKKNLEIGFVALSILTAALIVGMALFARAQTSSSTSSGSSSGIQGIIFPIPELGNCGSQDACRSYCDEPAHMEVCVSFAKAHGLMNSDEAARADRFKQALDSGSTPGGCKSFEECQKFCSSTSNIEVCLDFAQKMGVRGDDIDQAKKILAYAKGGGRLPGGCDSKNSCEAYCDDFSHADECLKFAQSAGVSTSAGGGGSVPPEQFQKFLELAKNGQTPGGCKSKDECETYCNSSGHMQECLDFAQKAGFISSDQAEKIKSLGGKGPGECDSPSSCQSYCNSPDHREECLKFAEEHGLVSEAEAKSFNDGFVRLREGISQSPPEIQACLKSVLGSNIIDDIQSGKLTPGVEIGEKVKACFEKFGHRADPLRAFDQAPEAVKTCLKGKLGADFDKIISGEEAPTPEMGDVFRVCLQGENLKQGNVGEGISEFVSSAPPEVAACLKSELGDEFEKIKSGSSNEEELRGLQDKIKKCLEDFQSGHRREFFNRAKQEFENNFGGGNASSSGGGGGAISSWPGDVRECVKSAVGEEIFDRLANGEQPSADVGQKISACFAKLRGGLPDREQFNNQPNPQNFQNFQGFPQPENFRGQFPGQPQEQNMESSSTQSSNYRANSLASVFSIFLELFNR